MKLDSDSPRFHFTNRLGDRDAKVHLDFMGIHKNISEESNHPHIGVKYRGIYIYIYI